MASRPSSPALISLDPQLVLLVGSALEQVHRGRPLGHATGLCLWAKSLAAVQAAQEPDGWAAQAYRYGAQPRLLWGGGAGRASGEAWRLCSAPLLSESLQSFLAETLLLWDHGGRREQQVGSRHFCLVELPALVLASQALQVALSVALVRTGNKNVTRTFSSWYAPTQNSLFAYHSSYRHLRTDFWAGAGTVPGASAARRCRWRFMRSSAALRRTRRATRWCAWAVGPCQSRCDPSRAGSRSHSRVCSRRRGCSLKAALISPAYGPACSGEKWRTPLAGGKHRPSSGTES